MSESLVGRRLGKYEIQAEIGKGGMGVVYQGYDPLLDRKVAIKVLAPHLVRERGYVERFLREARSAARLKHPGIVTVYDVGHDQSDRENWYYIVMEYLEGQTLAQILRQRGALPNDQVLAVVRRLGEALDYAHHYGLVHRDVKPGNVVVDAAGHATLTDFGVARAAGRATLTRAGALLGTPQYMSPEQAQGEGVDHRTDVFSLGVVAYEMLAGQVPYGTATPHAVLHQLIYEPPPSVRSRRPDLSAEVDEVLAVVLAKKPANRYQTASGFAEALGQALASKMRPASASTARPASPPKLGRTVSAARTASPPRSRRGALPAAAPRRRAQSGWGLWLGWLLVSVVGWTLGWIVAVPLGQAVSQPIGDALGVGVAEIVGGATFWAVVGLLLGASQWLVLRRCIRSSGWWVAATSVSMAMVGAAKGSQGPIAEAIMSGLMQWVGGLDWSVIGPLTGIGMAMIFEGLTGFVVGLTQWLVLQNQVQRAGRWAWISTLAWALGGAALSALGWAVGEPEGETLRWLNTILGGIIPGAIMATGLVRLRSTASEAVMSGSGSAKTARTR
jgi:predicted Ser/Thr protein kinase